MTDGCGLWLGYGYRQVRGRFFLGGGQVLYIVYPVGRSGDAWVKG